MSMPPSEPDDRGAAKVLVVERQIYVQPIEEERGVDEPIEEERRAENVPSAESEPRAAATQGNPDPHEESFRDISRVNTANLARTMSNTHPLSLRPQSEPEDERPRMARCRASGEGRMGSAQP